MKRYLLRFGIPTILAVMFVGILYILNSFELRTKTTATLVVSNEGKTKVYIPRMESSDIKAGDTVCVDQTVAGSLTLIVDSVRQEPVASVLYTHLPPSEPHRSQREILGGNTLSAGYIYTHSVKLRSLFFKRIGK